MSYHVPTRLTARYGGRPFRLDSADAAADADYVMRLAPEKRATVLASIADECGVSYASMVRRALGAAHGRK